MPDLEMDINYTCEECGYD